jgi:hypothetical protein
MDFQCPWLSEVRKQVLLSRGANFGKRALVYMANIGSLASAVDLTFASAPLRVRTANVKSKPALETYICWRPFGSDIRK